MRFDKHGIRKVAILVDCLDRATADRLLDDMGPEYARLVRETMVDLGDVDSAEQRRVIDEFLRVEPMVPGSDSAGIDLETPQDIEHKPRLQVRQAGPNVASDARSCRKSLPMQAAADQHKPGPASQPFQLLRDAEVDKLAKIFAAERPQTVALVLSHLPPDQAGRVLVRMSPQAQADVIHRLVELEEADPEILREVEQALESRLSEHIQIQRRRVAGLSAVAGILEAAGGRAGMEILDNLAAHDRQLAERLGPEPLAFEELVRLDHDALATVLSSVDRQLLILALVGAPLEEADCFLDLIPQSEAAWIRSELGELGPIRLADVTEARRRIADLARRMAAQGRIRWVGRVRFSRTGMPEMVGAL